MQRGINLKLKWVKTVIFDLIQKYMDPMVWEEFSTLLIKDAARIQAIQMGLNQSKMPPTPWQELSALIAEYDEGYYKSHFRNLSEMFFPGTSELLKDSKRQRTIKEAIEPTQELKDQPEICALIAEYEGSTYKRDAHGNYMTYDSDLPIYNHDLPSVRDLKAVFNLIVALEKGTERYSLAPLSVFKTFELFQYGRDIRRNFNIYMATNSVLTHHIDFAKQFFKTKIWPQFKANLFKIAELCNMENLEKVSALFIENIILLELYQQNYLLSKNKKIKETPVDHKEPTQEGFFSMLANQGDFYLRKIYKKNYDKYFLAESAIEIPVQVVPTAGPGFDKLAAAQSAAREVKAETPSAAHSMSLESTPDKKMESQQSAEDYYPDKKEDTTTVKELKKLLNGIIAITKVLNDYEGYSNAKVFGFSNTKAGWFTALIFDLTTAYNFFTSFDYKAIIADQSYPLAMFVKTKLLALHKGLERLACLVDELEWDQCLKENTLLKYVNLLTQEYTQITRELKIPVDYKAQKRTFYKARMEYRKKCVLDIEMQIEDLIKILNCKNLRLVDFPPDILKLLTQFIGKYEDSICIDRDYLEKYKVYLKEITTVKTGVRASVDDLLDRVGHRFSATLHMEMMKTLTARQLYLQKQKNILQEKIRRAEQAFQYDPFDHIKLAEIKPGDQKFILAALKTRAEQVASEKRNLFKAEEAKSAMGLEQDRPTHVKERLANQLSLMAKEYSIFQSALRQYETDGNYQHFVDQLKQEDVMSPATVVLIDEIDEVLTRSVNRH